MRDYLIFTIAAPMVSFSAQYSPGERRNAANRPSKSGVLGLIAAALGIERAEQARFDKLRDSLGFAVRVEEAGIPAFDYHTTQVPPTRRNRRFATRADELDVPRDELKTILSTREFRVNAFASPALWLKKPDAAIALNDIAAALQHPHFTLYAGRKSHPLMLPCRPCLLQADVLQAAFAKFNAMQPTEIASFKGEYLQLTPGPKTEPVIYCDIDAGDDASFERVEQRRDLPESRTKWRFGLRQEGVLRGEKPR
jgi:CRISPR system Cascade subunit CasD